MILIVCAVRDAAAGNFMRPFYLVSEGMAVRSFQDEVNRQADDNLMYAHPEDFELFKLGSWDDNSGEFDLLKVPKSLATAKQLKLA